MKYVNVIDAKEQFSNLITQLNTYQEDKIIFTYDDTPIVEMVRTEKRNPAKRRIGIAKNVWKLPPDFDEKFDAMDEEILRSFLPEETK